MPSGRQLAAIVARTLKGLRHTAKANGLTEAQTVVAQTTADANTRQ
jgi:hypothetical protein